MLQLLDRDGPALVIELTPELLHYFDTTPSMVLDLLKSHGYRDVTSSYAVRHDHNRYFLKD